MARFIADSTNAEQLRSRLTSKVVRGHGCWEWIGALNDAGYGVINLHGSRRPQVRAHRIAFYLAHGFAPEVVMHRCDNRRCVNPEHLVAGDHVANALDRDQKNRVAHGVEHYAARLTPAQVIDIRRRYEAGSETQKQIAEEFGVHRVTVGKIVRGVAWKRTKGDRSNVHSQSHRNG